MRSRDFAQPVDAPAPLRATAPETQNRIRAVAALPSVDRARPTARDCSALQRWQWLPSAPGLRSFLREKPDGRLDARLQPAARFPPVPIPGQRTRCLMPPRVPATCESVARRATGP